MSHIYLESYGVKLDVEVDDHALLPAVEQILPPGWSRSDDFPEDGHFVLSREPDSSYSVYADGEPLGTNMPADVAIHVLDAQLRARVAFLAQGRIFVHAGVVALDDAALVLPGPSFSGKSTLVAALVAAGATYYSDEFAVLDSHGQVHPYARALSIRDERQRWGDYTTVDALGGVSGDRPLAVGMIAIATYAPGAEWQPAPREPGIGALALLSNAVPARSRKEATLEAVSRAAHRAVVLEGTRGDAGQTARLLIDAVSATDQ